MDTLKISVHDILAKERARYESTDCTDYDLFEGYLTEEVLGMGDHSTTEYLVVIERDGKLWGWKTWNHDEVGGEIDVEMDDDSIIEFKPVEAYQTISYRFVE